MGRGEPEGQERSWRSQSGGQGGLRNEEKVETQEEGNGQHPAFLWTQCDGCWGLAGDGAEKQEMARLALEGHGNSVCI